MKAFLHQDNLPGSETWHRLFKTFLKRNSIPFVLIDLSVTTALDRIYSLFERGDCLIGRIKHDANLLSIIKPVYQRVSDLFEGRCFPSHQCFKTYDDKILQFRLFEKMRIPIPKSFVLLEPADKQLVDIDGPYVYKMPYGASSQNVKLISSLNECLTYPCIIQEF